MGNNASANETTTSNETNTSNESNTSTDASNQYVQPKMTDEVPILRRYCDSNSDNFSNGYHCRNLERVMFRAANQENHRNDEFFMRVTKGIVDSGEYEKDTKRDIGYHLNEMMSHKEPISTIVDTCHQFEQVCQKFATGNVTKESNTKSIEPNTTPIESSDPSVETSETNEHPWALYSTPIESSNPPVETSETNEHQ